MAIKDIKGMKPIGWYYELAMYYDDEKDEYIQWDKYIGFDKPNTGRWVRNVKRVYAKRNEK